MAGVRYHPFYCEENAWHLCQAPAVAACEAQVVLVTNPTRCVLLWHQRAASPGDPVAWDYHAIVVARTAGWQVWDPDCRLGCPLDAAGYLDATFATVGEQPSRFDPRFRVVAAADFVGAFRSDRSHMRAADGSWRAPPPPWEPVSPPGEGNNLDAFLDPGDAGRGVPGAWVDLDGLRARLSV